MKLFLSLLISVTMMALSINFAQNSVNIIPKPQFLTKTEGFFRLSSKTVISAKNNTHLSNAIDYLNKISVDFFDNQFMILKDQSDSNKILFSIDSNLNLNESYYELEINKHEILIKSSTEIGAFYGAVSLGQIIYQCEFINNEIKIPNLIIKDWANFKYRGMHLDCGRHFFSVDFIKEYIDLIALNKMNNFHWHLTEDQGWRIEIKKYPKLTEIGSFRAETMGDGIQYSGYYTQQQIKEIVNYAAKRYINVIPEIEMPGHSSAALTAYPEFSCTGENINVATTWGVFPDIYCAGKEQTFKFLEDILDEVCELFPSKYIHIGGDEAPKTRWKECEDCQRRIKDENLKDEHELQSYFISRIEKYLNSKGRKIIGWDEILEGGLAPDATVMSWRGESGGIESARQSHNVIMTPGQFCYFDHYQGNPTDEPLAIGGYTTLAKVYSYSPIPKELNKEEAKFILGAQANVWTEYIPTEKHAEYMILPRMAAMAEVLWSADENRNYDDFVRRLETQKLFYNKMGINYSESYLKPNLVVNFDDVNKSIILDLSSELSNSKIFYTLDSSKPNLESFEYKHPITINKTTELRAILNSNNLIGPELRRRINISKAFGKTVKYLTNYEDNFDKTDNLTLVNGLNGSRSIYGGNWQGFKKDNAEFIVDLGKNLNINKISTNYVQRNLSRVFLPKNVEYFYSSDGETFKQIINLNNDVNPKNGDVIIKNFTAKVSNIKARYVKVVAENIGICPDWHKSAGEDAWLLIDEIIIE